MLSRRAFLVRAAAVIALLTAAGSAAWAILRGLGGGSADLPVPPAPPDASSQPPPPPPPRRIPSALRRRNLDENRLPGSGNWNIEFGGRPTIPAFLDHASVEAGQSVTIHASGTAMVDVEWYRLGWYGGSGGRLMARDSGVLLRGPGGPPRQESETGLYEVSFPEVFDRRIGEDWPSGMYAVVVRPAEGDPTLLPLVVRQRAAAEPAPVLFVSAATTWQAYNNEGGKSVYDYDSTGFTPATNDRRAAVLSFDRPYAEDSGAGFLRRWELQFIRWQEREGRSVDYAADLDFALEPDVASDRRLIVFAGHHEYWSRAMRERLQAAIEAGTHVAFLSANEVYWQVRLGDSPVGRGRRITCYKSARVDPLTATDPSLATCRWREVPVSEPEAALIGEMYGHVVSRPTDWIVINAAHWLYEGTGLRRGDRIANLVGQEYDTAFPAIAPPGTELLAHSPVDAVVHDPHDPGAFPSPAIHNASIYTAASGATVFAAGTFQWSWALDDYGDRSYAGVRTPLDPRVQRMTLNLFDRLGDGPQP